MPNPYHLLSATKVTRAELERFIREQGGHLVREISYHGYVNRSRSSTVWIAWSTKERADWLKLMRQPPDSEQVAKERLRELEMESIIENKLGAPAKTCVFLDVLKNRSSERLALKLIKEFDKRWPPCVLRNFLPLGEAESGQNVWTIQELTTFSGSYGGLPR